MTTPTWPISLRNVNSFSFRPYPSVNAPGSPGDPKIFGHLTNSQSGLATVGWLWFRDEYTTFRTFWRDELLNGHRRFWIPLPNPSGVYTLQLAKFSKFYRHDKVGKDGYKVSAVLELDSDSVQYSIDPCLKFLMHFDGTLAEELGETPTSVGGTFDYQPAQFGTGFHWLGRGSPASPFQAWQWSGSPRVTDPLTTGWTLQFWTSVYPIGIASGGWDGLGHSTGRMPWLIIDSDLASERYLCFDHNLYCLGRSGALDLAATPTALATPGARDHFALVFDPNDPHAGGSTRFFFNGVHVQDIPGISNTGFSSIICGDLSTTLNGVGGSAATAGTIDEFSVWCCPQYLGTASFTPPTSPVQPYVF